MTFANRLDKAARHVRILTIDIEMQPALSYHWDAKTEYIPMEMNVEPKKLLCFSAKWLHEKQPLFFSGEGMAQAAWDLLSEADIVVTYNGDRYDLPHLNDEFLFNGLGPAAPFKSVDLIKTNRKRFNLQYRKLDYLAGRVLGDHKTEHQGFGLWLECMAGKASGWKLMQKYNMQDVKLTEQLYLELLPWIVDQPHIGLMTRDDNQRRCSHCGSVKLTLWNKPRYAYVRMYELHRCQSCGGWSHMTGALGLNHFTRIAK